MFNVHYDSLDSIKKIRATAIANMIAGITITEFISEGNQFQGVITAPTKEILLATELYLDEYQDRLVTETRPNFYTR